MDKAKVKQLLEFLYDSVDTQEMLDSIDEILSRHKGQVAKSSPNETILITYADSLIDGENSPLSVMSHFLKTHVCDSISAVHILPFYPFSSDDGFSIIDYKAVDANKGTWEDIHDIGEKYHLMFDAVINHASSKSKWFEKYLQCEKPYDNYFISCDPKLDYSKVVRPRTLPLLTKFETKQGEKYVWTTFSDDQIDLNYNEPKMFLEILDLLLYYAKQGAKFIRLDAIGFMFKQIGTTCIHLPKTHAAIELYRILLLSKYPDLQIITETNVPHLENISYFGNGNNEAHMVYQFALPPLVLYSFMTENTKYLTAWAKTLGHLGEDVAYFNFLASHDGIGLRPLEGMLSKEQTNELANWVVQKGGLVSSKTNEDGTKSPYELNCNYLSAVTDPSDTNELKANKFMASQAVILSMAGVPGIYIHSLLGSENWIEGVKTSGINRRINREKLDISKLSIDLATPETLRYKVFNRYINMLNIRKTRKEFDTHARQEILEIDERLFCILRTARNTNESILVVINFSNETVALYNCFGKDLISSTNVDKNTKIKPYGILWIEQR